jgi:hypothetical protein
VLEPLSLYPRVTLHYELGCECAIHTVPVECLKSKIDDRSSMLNLSMAAGCERSPGSTSPKATTRACSSAPDEQCRSQFCLEPSLVPSDVLCRKGSITTKRSKAGIESLLVRRLCEGLIIVSFLAGTIELPHFMSTRGICLST